MQTLQIPILILAMAVAPLAVAAPTSWKMLNCEMLLHPNMQRLIATRDIGPALAQYRRQLAALPPSALKAVNLKKVAEIEVLLRNTDPDRQVVTSQINGVHFRRAAETMNSTAEYLNQVYMQELQNRGKEIMSGSLIPNNYAALLVDGAVILTALFEGYTLLTEPISGMHALTTAFLLAGSVPVVGFYAAKTDWSTSVLKRRLLQHAFKVSGQKDFVRTSRFYIPAPFHQFLMTDGAEGDRGPALRRWARGFISSLTKPSVMRKEGIEHAGAPDRRIKIHHIVFYDESAGESRWLQIYEASRPRRETQTRGP